MVLREHADRIGEQVVDGPPDLVVEILSPGTARHDLGPKRAKYEQAGVPEYWIVDPVNKSVEIQVLEGGKYGRHALVRRDEILRSPLLPGLEVPLADVFVKA